MIVASFGDISGKQSVRVLRTAALLNRRGHAGRASSISAGRRAIGFIFSADGRTSAAASYLTGVSNIFRYEIATKKLEPMTNAETGFFRPIPLGGASPRSRLPRYPART